MPTFSPAWRATARLDNLTDVAYADRADYAFGTYRYFPGRRRTLFLELAWAQPRWDTPVIATLQPMLASGPKAARPGRGRLSHGPQMGHGGSATAGRALRGLQRR